MRRLFLLFLFSLFIPSAVAADPGEPPMEKADVPAVLKPWIPWVLADYDPEEDTCPFLYDKERDRQCIWPKKLDLALKATGGTFEQNVRVYRAGGETPAWLPLPGNTRHWPAGVTLDEKSVPVLHHKGRPAVKVEKPGAYTLKGKFAWNDLPEKLPLPEKTGLLALSLKGESVEIPDVDPRGRLWIRRDKPAEKTAANALRVEAFRHVKDTIPLRVTTRLKLRVAGAPREETLPLSVLPEGIPMDVQSPLPARLEKDGRLRLQVRPGTWTVSVKARHPGRVKALALPEPLPEDWPEREIWTFEAKRHLRQVQIRGVPAIDPGQTDLPRSLHAHPAYLVTAGDTLNLAGEKRSRANARPDRLRLKRRLIPHFNGKGMTIRDTIHGQIHRNWRLEIQPEMIPGRVAIDGMNQIITRRAPDAPPGVEVRPGRLNLTAESRIDGDISRLSAVGWQHDFENVSATLSLPPGWRLLHAEGVDSAAPTWLGSWTLLDLFIVLVVPAALFRMTGRAGLAATTFVTLGLIHPEFPALAWIALGLIALDALLGVLPEGRINRLTAFLRRAMALVLIVAGMQFIVPHIRNAVYPHLDGLHTGGKVRSPSFAGRAARSPGKAMHAESLVSSADQMQSPARLRKKARTRSGRSPRATRGKSAQNTYALQTLLPDANVQTGYGISSWRGKTVRLTWNGRVPSEQELRLHFLPQKGTLWLAFLRLVLLGITTAALVFSATTLSTASKALGRLLPGGARASGAALVLAATLSTPAMAEEAPFPPPHLLKDLREKLVPEPEKSPACLPHCAEIEKARISVSPRRLTVRARVHVGAEKVSVPLPGLNRPWRAQTVLVNGRPADAVSHVRRHPRVALSEGVHDLVLTGPLPPADSVGVRFPLKPRHLETSAEGWIIEGLRRDGRVPAQIHLKRERNTEKGGETPRNTLSPRPLPPFMTVTRTLNMGVSWTVETTVHHRGGAATVARIPLLDGESVTGGNVDVENGAAIVPLNAGERVSWSGTLPARSRLHLAAPEKADRVEIWRLDAGNIWHVDFDGIPRISPPGGEKPPTWRPWPGERLTMRIARPEAVPGPVRTIDGAKLTLTPGLRSTDARLRLSIRASRGVDHRVRLPEGAGDVTLKIDGRDTPLRRTEKGLVIPLHPGKQNVDLTWNRKTGIARLFTAPKVDIGATAVDVETTFNLSSDRWILMAGGEGAGPAILWWSLLPVALILALALGAVPGLPLKVHHWLLLFLGLMQTHFAAIGALALWFVALRQRKLHPPEKPWKFNATQLLLVFLTVAAAGALIAGIGNGLLGRPNMGITGMGSHARHLHWYMDISGPVLPQPWVLSLPMPAYHMVMLVWALWLAFAVTKWVRWAWTAFGTDGLWKKMTFRGHGRSE